MVSPKKFPDKGEDIPQAGINDCTSQNMQMDIRKQKRTIGGYWLPSFVMLKLAKSWKVWKNQVNWTKHRFL